jgi:crotonobetainyl-CoA:carnitine CoA-transferase CaiB-like acyl-CoA transferase
MRQVSEGTPPDRRKPEGSEPGSGAGEGDAAHRPRPLEGVRVLELGQILAGPLASSILAWYGAEVIKVELPGPGDPIRTWRVLEDGTSLWFRSLARNKKLVALDLRTPEGQALARRLALASDVLLENFRPGTLEGWNLDPAELRREKPELIVARISGFGQTGPYRERRGFASVCEAFGGLRYVTGMPGEPPVRSNLSIGDSVAAFQAVIGILLALFRRERLIGRSGDGRPAGGAAMGASDALPGELIDVAIYEAVVSLMEAALTEYDRRGVVREPSGTTLTGIVPTDAYPCADGRRVVIGANSDGIFQRLLRAAGRSDLAEAAHLATNDRRVAHREEIDTAIVAWTRTLPSTEVVAALERCGVPAAPVQTAADLVADPHVQSRALLEEVAWNGRPLRLAAPGPRLSEAPGRTDWVGGEVGADTAAVLTEVLGLGREEIAGLVARGVLGVCGETSLQAP